MNGAARVGTVYLVGAGPGDPELLTLRALRLLETADLILPDDLVSAEILSLAHAEAEIIPVGKRCGQPRITQEEIHWLMIDAAQAGRSVLRLKSGDPLIFGRVGEEIAALRDAEIPFEIVPGITTAFAAADWMSFAIGCDARLGRNDNAASASETRFFPRGRLSKWLVVTPWKSRS